MYRMSYAVVLVTAALALAAACGGDSKTDSRAPTTAPALTATSLAPNDTPTPTARVGEILTVTSPQAFVRAISAEPIWVTGGALRTGDELSTNAHGVVTFRTDDVEQCTAHEDSQIRIRPDDTMALQWFGTLGKTSCLVRPGTIREFGINNETVLRITGTIFQVQLYPDETEIRVLEGFVEVTDKREQTATVGPRQALVIGAEGVRGVPTPWQPNPVDADELEALRNAARQSGQQRSLSPVDLEPEECFENPNAEGSSIVAESVRMTACSNSYEVQLIEWIPTDANGDYPDRGALVEFAQEFCGGPNVFLVPSERQWNDLEFHQVGCLTINVPPPG